MIADPFRPKVDDETLVDRGDVIVGDALGVVVMNDVVHVFASYADFKVWQDKRNHLPLSAYRYRGVVGHVKLYGFKKEPTRE